MSSKQSFETDVGKTLQPFICFEETLHSCDAHFGLLGQRAQRMPIIKMIVDPAFEMFDTSEYSISSCYRGHCSPDSSIDVNVDYMFNAGLRI
ncbi:MAG: hypothetical protein WDO15_14565 [Bacteroidota bacterium]